MWDQLAPRLAAVVETTTRTKLRIARLRVILGSAAGLATGFALTACVAYAAGFASGRAGCRGGLGLADGRQRPDSGTRRLQKIGLNRCGRPQILRVARLARPARAARTCALRGRT